MPSPTQIQTALLAQSCFDSGPRQGPAIVLLHGWPDDAHGWLEVAASLNQAGWRTIVPFLRGFGPTRFLDAATPRSAQLTAFASDVLALADALDLPRFAIAGHDWGARTAHVLAALAPERLTHCIALSVGVGQPGATVSLQQLQQFWYQWFFALPMGEARLRADRQALCRHLWQSWSPGWQIDDAVFARTADAFENPDWIAITLHGYRHRWGLVEGDPRYAEREQRLAEQPPIHVPTLLLHGADDRCIEPASSEGLEARYTRAYRRVALTDCGHFPQREQPATVAHHILDWLQAHAA